MELACVHAVVDTFLGKQFLMGSLLGNPAVMDHNHPIGLGNR